MNQTTKFALMALAPLLMLLCISTAFAQLKEVEPNCDVTLEASKKYIDIHRHPDGIIKVLPGCPGYDDVDPGYGNFWQNGVNLRIPRNYLSMSVDEADGAAINLFLIYTVPSFKPSSTKAWNERPVEAIFRIANPAIYCSGTDCYSWLEMELFGIISGLKFLNYPEEVIAKAQKLLSLVDRNPERKGYYLFEGEGFTAAFQEKNDKIVQWYYCEKLKSRCTSLHLYDEKILIRLSLPSPSLPQMIKYKNLFYEKLLKQFVVEGDD